MLSAHTDSDFSGIGNSKVSQLFRASGIMWVCIARFSTVPCSHISVDLKLLAEDFESVFYPSGLVGSEESGLGFPLHPEYAIQTDANWYFLHGIFG